MKNRLNSRCKLLFLMFWTFLFTVAKAQPNLAFYPLEDQFNSFDYNPAFLTSPEKFTFSLAPLAGMHVGYNNQRLINSLVSKFLKGVITNQDYKNVFTSMVNQNYFQQDIEGSWLSFTYRSEKGFFNFRIKDSEYFLAKVEGDATKFIFNSDITSTVIGKIQHLPAQSAHYREYSLGYAYESPSKRLKAGIRGKLYFGKFAFFSTISGSIQEDPNAPNNFHLRTSGVLNISFPDNTIETPNDTTNTIVFSSSTIFRYLLNSGNPGLGVDLGINYQLSPELSFSASIIDLGKINWKSNLNSRSLNDTYPLDPGTYNVSNVGGVPTINKIGEFTYSDSFDFSRLSHFESSFSKPLPLKLYAGVKYQVDPRFSLSLTDKYVVIKDLSYNNIAVTASFDVNKKLSLSSGYTFMGGSYFNIPLGLLYQGNFSQIFLATDNLTSFLFPSYAEYAGFSFGVCFYLFTRKNLYLKPSDETPFYRPRKIIKNRKSGLIIKPSPIQ